MKQAQLRRTLATVPKSTDGTRTLPQLLGDYERLLIVQALQMSNFSRKVAADMLGVSKLYLYRRMTLLKMDFKVFPRTTPGRPRKGGKILDTKAERG
jgi:DNA-binding NtrC family response regulator